MCEITHFGVEFTVILMPLSLNFVLLYEIVDKSGVWTIKREFKLLSIIKVPLALTK